ncbi:hypothetical protein WCU55_05620 [Pectobacterium carotovorum]|nr:hypothetical protein NAL19_1292 [Pectobacterium sp. F1-1]
MGSNIEPFNSNKMDRECERIKTLIIDDVKFLNLIKTAIDIAKNSGIDNSKSRYKSETETSQILNAAIAFNNGEKTNSF